MVTIAPNRPDEPRPTVLVVDQERLTRWCLRHNLEERGFRVLEAESVAAALGCFDRFGRIDAAVIAIDLANGGSDGLARIRAAAPSCRLLVSATIRTPELEEEAAALGAMAIMPKPFLCPEVVARLEVLLPVPSAR